MKKWWCTLSLQRKLQLPIQTTLLVVLVLVQCTVREVYKERIISDATARALVSADGVLNGLNMLMISGIISHAQMRELFVKKMGSTEKVMELRVIRSKPLNDQFGPGLASEQPVDQLDRDALTSAKIQSVITHSGDLHTLRIVVPFIAKAEFRGTNCLSCHRVSEGAVNGAASITFNLSDEFSLMRQIDSWFWAAQVLLQIFLFLMIGWIIRVVTGPARQLQTDLAKLSKGDFTGDIKVSGGDEISVIAETVRLVNAELGRLVGDVKFAALSLAKTAQRVAMVSSMTSAGVSAQKVKP